MICQFSVATRLSLVRERMISPANRIIGVPRERLWAEIRHNMDKDLLQRSTIEVPAMAADPPVSLLPTVRPDTRVVVLLPF